MRQYSQQELDAKIDTFLTQKFQKYPEFAKKSKAVQTETHTSLSSRIVEAFTLIRPLASH